MNIGLRLKHFRELRQLDHATLSNQTGIPTEHLVAVEDGSRPLSHAEVQSLIKVLGITIDDLFNQDQPEEASADSALIPQAQLSALLDQMKK